MKSKISIHSDAVRDCAEQGLIMIKTLKTNYNSTESYMSLFNCFFSTFLLLCSCNQTDSKFDGKWSITGKNYREELVLRKGYYIKHTWDDDLIIKSTGKYYLNDNLNRTNTTITLIPNKIISEDDTIFQECESIDIVAINDSDLFVQRPTQWIKDENQVPQRLNPIIIYRKMPN